MQKKSKQIGIACGMGTFLGILLGLGASIEFGLGWWMIAIGALVGGAAAYLSYDLNEVGRAFVRAWRALSGYEPDRELAKRYWRHVLVLALIGLTFGLYASGGLFIMRQYGSTLPDSIMIDLAFGAFVFVIMPLLVAAADVYSDSKKQPNRHERLQHIDKEYERVKWLAWRANPISFPFWCMLGILLLARWFVMNAIPFLFRVPWKTFCAVHSNKRTLCFVDTVIAVLIGGVAGYSYGSLLYGMLIGVPFGILLGIASFEILSVRLLKLVPRDAR
ncbi:hypothetical protein IIA95_01830 [Patescibacteria group bacterium]|nr:hypothetical protein [Patescibacteria group bacterium]